MCEENKGQQIYTVPFSQEDYQKSFEAIREHNQMILGRIIQDFKESRNFLNKEIGIEKFDDDVLKMIG